MGEHIKKIQAGLTGIINERLNYSFITKYAHVFVLAYPIHSLLYLLPYTEFIYKILSWTGALCYILSLLGLLICFARNDIKKLGIYFALNLASSIINLFKYSFNINNLIYVIFYLFFTFLCFKYRTNYSPEQLTETYNKKGSGNTDKCKACGKPLKPNASFCAICGTKVE